MGLIRAFAAAFVVSLAFALKPIEFCCFDHQKINPRGGNTVPTRFLPVRDD